MGRKRGSKQQINVIASGERSVAIGPWAHDNWVVTGDYNIIIQYLTSPIRRLPTDYATRIENFIRLYLGTPEEPVPFGGRDNALRDLDAWLANPDQPYALLTAPAGQGKSALLVRWIASLRLRQPDWHVVFLPVSMRFSTNLASVTFAALTAQLARAFDEPVPAEANTPDQVWRGMFTDYLKRKPPAGGLLVILDGVDEAANWDVDGALFPLEPAPGLKVLVSARLTAERHRAEDWQRALAWERLNVRLFHLAPLDRPGLQDVLEKMGVPLDELARQPFIIKELYRLTGGDPLLTNFYVLDLWQKGEEARRLRPEDLHTLKPGYEGYFDDWWKWQRELWGEKAPLREPAVREVLNLLSCALGPLRPDDLLVLADPAAGLDSWMLEESLHYLARFVAKSQDAYVFAHPRLPEYFWNRLSDRERRALERRFLDWGRAVLDELSANRLPPRQAPLYLVRYYRAHLERARAPLAELRCLVENHAWAQAWEALEGSFGGYLGDVQAVWQCAIAENRQAVEAGKIAPYLGLEIRCALIESSLHSLFSDLLPLEVMRLLRSGIWTPRHVLAYVRQNLYALDDDPRGYILALLAPYLTADIDLMGEALAIAQEIQDEYFFGLNGLAPYVPEALMRDALKIAREIWADTARACFLVELAPRVPPDLRDEYLSTVGEIREASERTLAMAAIASHLPLDQRVQVLEAARKHQSGRAKALAILAPHLPDALRAQVLDEALAGVRETDSDMIKADVLIRLAPHLSNDFSTALAAARAIPSASYRAKALLGLALYSPAGQREQILREAVAATLEIESGTTRAETLSKLAPHLPEELLGEALVTAQEIRNEWERAEALAILLPYLPAKVREQIIDEILAVTRVVLPEWAGADVLAALVPYLPQNLQAQVVAEVLAATRKINDTNARSCTMISLVPHLPQELREQALFEAPSAAGETGQEPGPDQARSAMDPQLSEDLRKQDPHEALAAAREIRWELDRAKALTTLLPQLPEELREQVLDEALAAAGKISHERYYVEALARLAPYLSGERREQALSMALAVARAISYVNDRAEALFSLVPHLPEGLQEQVLGEALSAGMEIRDEFDRSSVLTDFLPYLPEETKIQALNSALTAAAKLRNRSSRDKFLSALASHLAVYSPPSLYSLWEENLPILARRTRADLLSDLRALAPLIHALGGQEAVVETFRAIQDVGRWWP